MKKTYEAPKLVISGDVVRVTLIGDAPACESDNPTVNQVKCPGDVGYYL